MILVHPARYRAGTWSADGGASPAGISAGGRGFVKKGKVTLSIAYTVSGSGAFDNSEKIFLERMGRAAEAEAAAVLASIRIVKDGAVTLVPYSGPALDGSDVPVVRVSPETYAARVGAVVPLKARVEGARPEDAPVVFEWAGTTDASGDRATLVPATPGTYTVTCRATGGDGVIGSASAVVEVRPIAVSIRTRVPEARRFRLNYPASLLVDVSDPDSPLRDPAFFFHWEPDDLSFWPQDSAATHTDIALQRPEQVTVRVSVRMRIAGRVQTLATSPPITLEWVTPEEREQRPAPKPPGTPAPPEPTKLGARPSPAGRWQYRSGGFSDTHVLRPDGRAESPRAKQPGSWTLANGRLTVRWSNPDGAWINEYSYDPTSQVLDGVTVSPSGGQTSCSLTFLETPADAPGSPGPATGPGTPAPPGVSGLWRTNQGNATLVQAGAAVTGRYDMDNGEIIGTMSGNVLEGFWIEDASGTRCQAPKNGRYFWGWIRWTFSDDAFTGEYGWCDRRDEKASWTGTRGRQAP